MSKSFSTWRLARDLCFAMALMLSVYFALFQKFLPPFELSQAVRGYGDHNLHMIAFVSLSFLLLVGRNRILYPVILLVLLAIGLEASQLWFPERGANLADLYASITGVIIGAIVAALLNRWFLKRLK